MAQLSEEHLLLAILGEIIARDLYKSLAGKVQVEEAMSVMSALSREEEKHRITLAARYRAITGTDYVYDPNMEAGPDYSFLEKSVFGHTQAIDALTLALGAEIDAAGFYAGMLQTATANDDMKMLKTLVRFEKQHQKTLRKEIARLEKSNHWGLS